MCVLWVKPFTCERGTVQDFQRGFYCTGEYYCGKIKLQFNNKIKCLNPNIPPTYSHMSDINEVLQKYIVICNKRLGTNSTTVATEPLARRQNWHTKWCIYAAHPFLNVHWIHLSLYFLKSVVCVALNIMHVNELIGFNLNTSKFCLPKALIHWFVPLRMNLHHYQVHWWLQFSII